MEEKINEILKLTETIHNCTLVMYILFFLILVGGCIVAIVWSSENEKERQEKKKKAEQEQLKRDVKKEIIDYYNETKEFNGGGN